MTEILFARLDDVDASAAEAASAAAEASAQAAQDAAESVETFAKYYLGPASSDPTVDGNGDPVVEGAWYFNTTSDLPRIYDGADWHNISSSGGGGGGLEAVVDDPAPVLGGDLDPDGHLIAGRDVAADGTKLDGIEDGATADMSASEILTAIKTVDGSGSGLDADTLDGNDSASFQPVDSDLTAIAALTTTSFGRGLLELANATALAGVVDSFFLTPTEGNAAYQPLDAELTALAGLTSAADRLPYFTGSGTAALATFTAAARNLLDDADASTMRTTLGLVIGTDVQAQDAELAAIAGLTSAADRLPYFTGSGSAALATFTSFGRSLVDDADASAGRTTLGLVIGTDVQAFDADLSAIAALSGTNNIYYRSAANTWTAVTIGGLLSFSGGTLNIGDAELTALAGLTSAADKLPYFTGSGTAALADFTTFGRSLVDDADATAARTTLGLGNSATRSVGTTAGTVAAGDDTRLAGAAYTVSEGSMAGVSTVDLTLPAGFKSFELILSNIRWASDADISMLLRVSLDGSTYLSTSSYKSTSLYAGGDFAGAEYTATDGMDIGGAGGLSTASTLSTNSRVTIFPGTTSYASGVIAQTMYPSSGDDYGNLFWDRCLTVGRAQKIRILNDAGINFTNDSYYQLVGYV